MQSLIVALANSLTPADSWRYAVSPDAGPDAARAVSDKPAWTDQGVSPMALLPRSDELVVVVPAPCISWHLVNLPKVNAAKLRNALEGLLEERVLDDPQLLHFALAPAQQAATNASAEGARPVWVAACDKNWLTAQLQVFEAAGRTVSRIVPEFAPLAAGAAPVLVAQGSPELANLVRCADDGVHTMPLTHDSSSARALRGNASDSQVQLLAEPAVAQFAEQVLGLRAQVQHRAQALVQAARSTWNLAQFDLASNAQTRLLRRLNQVWSQWLTSAAWRPVRWGVVCLVLAHLLGLNLWAWQERSALAAQRAQISNVLTSTFPKIPLVVNAPLQMQREVQSLRQATGAASASDLEPMLASLARLAPAGLSPIGLDYADQQLRLKGLTLSPEATVSLQAKLSAAGYSLRQDQQNWMLRALAPTGTESKP